MVVACRKSGSKFAKGMDPIKDFIASKQRAELCYRAYPITKLDQSRAGKRKALMGQDPLGQKAKDGPVITTVGLLKRAPIDFSCLTNQDKAKLFH